MNNNTLIVVISALSGLTMAIYSELLYVSIVGIVGFVFFTLRLLHLIGNGFPLRELIVSLMLLQMVVCPIITYNYFDNQAMFTMELDEQLYLNFVVLTIIAFAIGLLIRVPLSGQKPIQEIADKLMHFNKGSNSKIGVFLVLIGFLSLLISEFVPPAFSFLLYLIGHFRFVGVFYLIFSDNSYKLGWLFLVFGHFAYETVASGIFINLFIWSLLLYMVLGFEYKLSLFFKTGIFVSGVFLAFFIQSFKSEYREIVWSEQEPIYQEKYTSKHDAFVGKATEKVQETEELYEYSNLNRFVSRLNQGWILTKVLNHVPFREPFANGETVKNDLYAALVPRFIDPNKTIAGGKEGAEKFARFTGKHLLNRTRMTIGVLGDAYVNYGPFGASIFMFLFGVFLNLGINLMITKSNGYLSLFLWIPFVFAISMRAGNEFVAILNYITKSGFLVFVIFWVFGQYFLIDKRLDHEK